MKRALLLLTAITITTLLSSQTTVFHENFELTSLADSVTSSGTTNWAISTKYAASGLRCDSSTISTPGDTSILTTNSFSTTGYSNVSLQFSHICKVDFTDKAIIQVSTNNGLNWTQLTALQYLGTGQFSSLNNQFSSISYIDWLPVQNSAIPASSWWRNEVFDISSLVANSSQVMVRFVLIDPYFNGGNGNYGWLIDDIKIIAATGELIPPTISIQQPIYQDTVYHTGPYDIYANINDSSGIDTAKLTYTVNGINPTTIGMVNISGPVYKATTPSHTYNTSICYYVEATDLSTSSNSSQYPSVGCQEFYIKKGLDYIQIGHGNNSGYKAPIYNSSASSADKHSNHISLFDASELLIDGPIKSIGWSKSDYESYNLGSGVLNIYLKHTTSNIVNSSTSFATELSGATLIYSDSNQNISNTIGWKNFAANTVNTFIYNGTDNLMVLVEWYRPNNSTGAIKWDYTTLGSKAISFFGSSASPTNSTAAGERPNIKIGYQGTPKNYDAGLFEIISPSGVQITSTPVPVSVRIKNYGTNTLTKTSINWSIDGVLQTPYNWTGSLVNGIVSNTITIDNKTFTTGAHIIKAWTSQPNDSTDQFNHNDTLTQTFHGCTQILNGTYTVGGSSADFPSLADVRSTLITCGVNGSVTFNINPGTYNEQLILDTNIVGLTSYDTITVQSSTGVNTDVVLEHGAGSASDNYVILVDRISNVKIKNITLKASGSNYASVIVLRDGVNHSEISGNIITSTDNSSATQSGGIFISKDFNSNLRNDYNIIQNNVIEKGRIGISIYANYNISDIGNIIEGNTITGFHTNGIVSGYNDSLIIKSNTITSALNASMPRAIVLNYMYDNCLISKNQITVIGSGYLPEGIELNQCAGSAINPNMIVNNLIAVNGTTPYLARGIYLYGGSFNKFYYNSVNLATGSNLSSALSVNIQSSASGGSNEFKNNIFSNSHIGFAFEVNANAVSSNVISNSDYNNFHTAYGILGNWGNSTISLASGISALTALSSMDSNSFTVNPDYYGLTNLHSFSQTLDGAAKSITGITEDIDGDLRSITTPDIGADEFFLSTVDAGILSLIEPLAVDTQNNVVALKVLARNFGLDTLTSMNIKFSLNGATVINTPWTGSINPGSTQSITLGNITIPAGNYQLIAFTQLTGDTTYYNDTLISNLYGLPLIDAEVIEFLSPVDGCDMDTNEVVKIKIKNNGVNTITSGLTVSYQIVGGAAIVTENITTPINPGADLIHTFANKANLSVTTQDSLFTFKTFTSHTADPISSNDTLFGQAISLSILPAPIINDTTINYGNSVTITAVSNFNTQWYADDTTSTAIASGLSFTTPQLFDTITYYVEANTNIPALTKDLGTALTTNAPAASSCVYEGDGSQFQILVLASELQNLGIAPGNITSLAFYLQSTTYNTPHAQLTIKMGHTTATALTTNFITSGLTQVFQYPFTEAAGWNTHTFSTPFNWDGNSNVVINMEIFTDYGNPQLRYTATTFNSVAYIPGMGAAGVSTQRPNMRFTTDPVLGCNGIRTSVNVNVPLPVIDANMAALLTPNSSCGLNSTPIECQLINNGTDTIPSGFSVNYKINSGSFITPEVINTALAPTDTLNYTFNTLASLPSGANGTYHSITLAVSAPNDLYSSNDTLFTDSIWSEYTPNPPVVTSPVTINYGDSVTLNATAIDSIFWYTDSLGMNLIGEGSNITTGPVFGATNYYASTTKSIPLSPYDIGNGTTTNTTSVGPSPFGAQSYTAWGLKNQFLIRASEMTAMGMLQGNIESLAFNIQTASGNGHNDFTIKLGTTTMSSLTSFVTSGLTTVYDTLGYNDHTSWNTFDFNAPFYWDGTSNIVVQTCFKNTAWVTTGYAKAYYTNTSFVSSLNSYSGSNFNCNDIVIDNQYSKRPNIRFMASSYGSCSSACVPVQVNVMNIPSVDASITELPGLNGISPCNTVQDVKVILKNYGTSNLTFVNIQWSVNDTLQTPYVWTGSLPLGAVDTITIANTILPGGLDTIRAWVNNPNNTPDTLNSNDTSYTAIGVSMVGNFAIGQNARFKTFNEAIATLDLVGACGHVIFNVDSGQYVEQLTIEELNGVGPNSTVTFQSADGDSTYVELFWSPSTTKDYTIFLDGADYISFKKMKIKITGNTDVKTVKLGSGATHNSIENCIIIGAVSTNSGSAAIYSSGLGNDYNTFKDNYITQSYQGIYIKSDNSLNHFTANIISGNKIYNFYRYGIYLFYADSNIIDGNKIINGSTTYSSITGIFMLSSNGSHEITNNNVILDGGGSGNCLRFYNGTSVSSKPALIANNFFGFNNSTGATRVVETSSCNYANFYFNTVNLGAGDNTATAFYSASTGSNIKVKNNIFSSLGQGYSIYVASPTVTTEFDYNNIYADSTISNFAFWISNMTGFTALKQSTVNKNQNSIVVNPNYFTSTDLHTVEIDLNGTGTPITGITTDIDGETRSTSTPDIGADEFTPAPLDLGAIALVSPVGSDCFDADMPVVIRIKNFGINPINFAVDTAFIHVVVNGVNPNLLTPFQLDTGILAVGSSWDIKVTDTLDMSIMGSYTFNAYTTVSGDGYAINDAMTSVAMDINPVINSFPFDDDFETFVVGTASSNNPGTIKNGWTTISNISNMRWYPYTGTTYTSGTGPTGDHTTGNGKYMYFESSWGTAGSMAHFTSNCLDLSSLTVPTLDFYYHMYGNGIGTLFIEAIDSNANWVIIDSLVGQQQTLANDPWLRKTVILTNFKSEYTRIRFTAVKASGDGDIAIDDILIYEPVPLDIGVISLIQPTVNFSNTGNTITVEMEVRNYGSDTLNNIPVGYIYSTTTVLDTIQATLLPGAITTHLFTTQFAVLASNQTFNIFTGLTGDNNTSNDTLFSQYSGLATYQLNWSDDFEGVDNWASTGNNNLWQRGIPTATTINAAHSTTNVWATNLSGQYTDNSLGEMLFSPYFIIPVNADTATLEFWQWMDVEPNNDFGRIEYSVNGGSTWSGLGYIGIPGSNNWYNAIINGLNCFSSATTGWQHSSIKLDPTAFNLGTPVQFRFSFYSNGSVHSYDGWAIDDFEISLPPIADDCGVISINYPVNDTAAGSSVIVDVTIENFGINSQNSIPVSLVLNNTLIVTDTITTTLASLGTMTHSFSIPYTVPINSYNLCAFTSLVNDAISTNDSICANYGVTAGANDVGISMIVEPSQDTLCSHPSYYEYDIVVRIKNYGTNPQTSIPVEYQVGVSAPISETWSGTALNLGDSVDYTFNTKYLSTAFGNFNICARTTMVDLDLTNDESCKSYATSTCTGLGEYDFSNSLTVYPNPSTGMITIDLGENYENLDIIARNMVGQIIKEFTVSESIFQINLESQPKGVYYIQIQSLDFTIVKKIIIE